VLYGIAATAEVNRAPFDLPEAEQELVAGYLTEFSGLRWSLYQMAEYINMITVSSVAATLFLGGWTLGGLSGIPGLPIIWYAAKVAVFLFIFIWVRATLPRIRYDQLMRVGWQVLLPLALLNTVFTGLAIALGWPWWASGVFGLGVLALSVLVLFVRMRRRQQPVAHPSGEAVSLPIPASVRLVQIAPSVPGVTTGAVPSTTEEAAEAVRTP
jgi:NADH-quinone oxidoreductase subunit H